ncbi:hypothetical protein [Novosphingobium malaysiense]|uniref:Lipoprotein n=1 Tax=Novosphingobium malaysiense TaxID=1348853 RepID=A0A0B1ZPI9_9SPHN|nr:hypothetical protein [Novosphingobium malaysiense]KHK91087.1 hypothetical protein LK12_09205 [Novosphingobium malaysiense]
MRQLALLVAVAALAACSQEATPTDTETGSASTAPETDPSGNDDDTALSRPADEWRQYRNERFAFAIGIPPGFAAQPAPQNGDGRVFTRERATMRISGRHNMGATFSEQIAKATRGLTLETQERTSPQTWQAMSKGDDGRRTFVELARASGRVVTVRFDYPENDAELERQAGHALDGLLMVERAGPLTYEFKPDRFALTEATISLPGKHSRAIEARKLIPWARAAKLGDKACRYGQSGRTQTCNADKEAGLAFAVLDRTISSLRDTVPQALIEPSSLAGKDGFRVVEQAEGAGTSYAFVPAGDRTVAVVKSWRSGSDKTGFEGVLRNLSIAQELPSVDGDGKTAMSGSFQYRAAPT